jgi:hypothetical protein
MSYLGDLDLARQLVELGVKGGPNSGMHGKGVGEVLTREGFREKHELDARMRAERQAAPRLIILSQGRDVSHSPFLSAIADREELCRIGKLSTILFIRDRNSYGQEVSGYIDLNDRLQSEDFSDYFDGRRKLLPKKSDLSFFNWENMQVAAQDSPNWQVLHSDASGLKFKHKKDRKVLTVDPRETVGDNSRRFVLETDEYIQPVIFFDHVTRRRA